MESSERAVAMEIPVNDGVSSCSPPTVPMWLKKRLSEPKPLPPLTAEEIEAKLRDADLRRQKVYEHLSKKARPKPSSSRFSSNEDDLGQRLEAKLLAAEEKRLNILTNARMRLAKVHELRVAAKTRAEMRFKQERAELGTKMEMRVRQAEANRLRILLAYRQRSAAVKERASQSLSRRMARDSKYKERVHAAIYRKRTNAEKKRLSLLEEEKRRARAWFLKVQNAANSVSHEQEIQRKVMKGKLEDRIHRARRKRAEYLKQRGKPFSDFLDSLDLMHDKVDTSSSKLARCWRKFMKVKKTTASLARAYDNLNINEKSAKSMPFEQFALLIQSSFVIRTSKAFLDRLEFRYKLSRAVGRSAAPSGSDDIDHLLKRVASPKKRDLSKKSVHSDEHKNSPSSKSAAARSPLLLSRYQVRIVLCAYMVVGHPDAVISGRGERETALVKSAENFVKEFDLLMKILLDGPLQILNDQSVKALGPRQTFRSQLAAFDSAWCSLLNSFVVWKAKDAKSLEEDLVRAACRLELSMLQTCKMTSEADRVTLSHDLQAIQKQVSEDQKLLKEKVLHLSGDAGIEHLETAISDARMKFFNARESGSHITPSSLSSVPTSSSTISSSDKVSDQPGSHKKQNIVARSLFEDETRAKDANSSLLANEIPQPSRETLDIENIRIVNEYVHGEHLPLDNGNHQNDVAEKIKETMEKAFWEGIIDSVRRDEPDYSRVVELMKEVRDGICSMAPLSWRQEITETIDLEILTEVLNCGKLDVDYLGKILEYALLTLRKLSAPAHEEELINKHQKFMKYLAERARGSSDKSQIVALIEGLRFVLEQLQELKQEVSKARIRLLEPFLKGPDALHFLEKAFVDRHGHPRDAQLALPLSAKWLSSADESKAEEWNEHKNFLSEMMITSHDVSSTFLPSINLRTGGEGSFAKLSGSQVDPSSLSNATSYIETIDPHLECRGEEIDLLVRLGLLRLVRKIAGLTEAELPETMKLNHFRLRRVQSDIQKIIVVATSLLVLRQTLISQNIASSKAHMDTIISDTFERLSHCLNTVEDAGIDEIIQTLSSSIEKDGSQDSDNIDPMMMKTTKEIMARTLTKSLQEEDAVFARVSRAVYLALRGVVLGGKGKQGRELAEMALQKVGAGLLVDEVVRVGCVLVVVAKVSVMVHGPWYENLIKG